MASEEDRRSEADRRDDTDRKKGGDRRSGANRRSEARTKKRIRCEVSTSDESQGGFVLDLSPKGLFVQTAKPIDAGVEIGVSLDPPGMAGTIELRAKVVRSRRVPAKLASIASPGVGLRVTKAPPEWYEFVADLTSSEPRKSPGSSAKPKPIAQPTAPEKAAAPVKPAPKKRKRKLPPRMAPPESTSRYRVQAKHISGPRSRSLVLRATSLEDAKSMALEQLGGDWKIIGIKGA